MPTIKISFEYDEIYRIEPSERLYEGQPCSDIPIERWKQYQRAQARYEKIRAKLIEDFDQ